MLILLCIIAKGLLNNAIHIAQALWQPVLIAVIMVSGIILIFSAVGIPISRDLASTVIGGIFGAIGVIFNTAVQLGFRIGRGIRNLIVSAYGWTRRTLRNMGASEVGARTIALLVTIVLTIIII